MTESKRAGEYIRTYNIYDIDTDYVQVGHHSQEGAWNYYSMLTLGNRRCAVR
jgi:hypothetical protein